MGKLEIKKEKVSRDFEFESENLRLVGDYSQLTATGELISVSANAFTPTGENVGYVRAYIRDGKLALDNSGMEPDMATAIAEATTELFAMVTGNDGENEGEGGES